MFNQRQDEEPNTEKITMMSGASWKLGFVDYCYKRGVGVSEQLRIIVKEWFQFREYWRSLETRVKRLLKDNADLWEIVSYFFNRMRFYRNENKRLIEFIKKNNLKVQSDGRWRFDEKKPDCFVNRDKDV